MNDAGGMLSIWCVYDHPLDFPDHYVARRWLVSGDGPIATADIRVARTLGELRTRLPLGLHRIERSLDDDPTVVETWL